MCICHGRRQRGYALYKGEMNHVKLLGQLFDRCQLVLVQLVEFLSRSSEEALRGTSAQSYLELLPNLQTLCVVPLVPEIIILE